MTTVLFVFALLIVNAASTADPIFGDHSLSIGAFNVQIFGQSKLKKAGVLPVLVKAFRRWDIGLIQEIRDSSALAAPELLKAINDWDGPKYKLVLSARSGRSNSKEQYGFFYREDVVSVSKQYDFDDSKADIFEREPFPVLFRAKHSKQYFFIIPLHSKPDDAGAEIDHLLDVYADAKKKFKKTAAILMGDFNADCGYLSDTAEKKLSLYNSPDFKWLIDKDADTTVAKSSCAYDRFIVTNNVAKVVKPDSARVFRFDLEYKTNAALTKTVSDHYPIEMALKNCGRKGWKRELSEDMEQEVPCLIQEPEEFQEDPEEEEEIPTPTIPAVPASNSSSNSPTPPPPVERVHEEESSSLSAGAIAGISIAGVLGVLIIAGVVFLMVSGSDDGYNRVV